MTLGEFDPQALPRGTERILLVDDEPDMVASITLVFKYLGYQAQGFITPGEALDAFRKEPDQYDLLVLDHFMLEMDGMELARRVRTVRSDVPMILCSGYCDKVPADQLIQVGVQAVLNKPVSLEQWARTIRRVLDQNQPGE